MKRRSFLTTAAALLPAAGFEAFALAQASSAPSAAEVHLVSAGQDRMGEVHSRGFSSILFKVLPRETNAGLFILEHANLMKGGPPLHLHPHQEEWFYLIEGEVLFQIGEQRKRASRRFHPGTARHSPHLLFSWRETRPDADCLYPGREDGRVSARDRGSQPAASGCRLLPAL